MPNGPSQTPTARTEVCSVSACRMSPTGLVKLITRASGATVGDDARETEHLRDRSHRHGEAGRPGRLLPQDAVAQGDPLVGGAAAVLPHADRGEHEAGTGERRSRVRLGAHVERTRPTPGTGASPVRTSPRGARRPRRAGPPRSDRGRARVRRGRAARRASAPPFRPVSASSDRNDRVFRSGPQAHCAPLRRCRSALLPSPPAWGTFGSSGHQGKRGGCECAS